MSTYHQIIHVMYPMHEAANFTYAIVGLEPKILAKSTTLKD